MVSTKCAFIAGSVVFIAGACLAEDGETAELRARVPAAASSA